MSVLTEIADEKCELEMTPMIDVTFLLLIFFLLTLKFKTLEGKLAAYLPKDVGMSSAPAEPKEKIEIRIDVKAEGTRLNVSGEDKGQPWTGEDRRYSFSGRVIQYSINAFKSSDPDKVRERLKKMRKEDMTRFPGDEESWRDVTIDSRKGTVYADVVLALDACIQAGFSNITFVGDYED